MIDDLPVAAVNIVSFTTDAVQYALGIGCVILAAVILTIRVIYDTKSEEPRR
jgi:hypothetical protein